MDIITDKLTPIPFDALYPRNDGSGLFVPGAPARVIFLTATYNHLTQLITLDDRDIAEEIGTGGSAAGLDLGSAGTPELRTAMYFQELLQLSQRDETLDLQRIQTGVLANEADPSQRTRYYHIFGYTAMRG